jgi:hypothetical protein
LKRPKSHQIDTQAQNILHSKLPTNWILRKQDPDYGIDYEIEVVHGEQSSGIWFRIQLKGKEQYRETEDSIAIRFKTDTIKYYLSKVPFPVFLFVVHTQRKEIHWLFLQKYVNEILKVENPKWMEQKSVTIKIPKKNRFYNNAKEIEVEAKDGMLYAHLLRFGTLHWSLDFKIKGAIDDIVKFEEERKRRLREQNEMDLHLSLKYYYETENKEKSQQILVDIFNRTKGQEDYVLEHLASLSGILSFYPVFDEKQNFEIFELSRYGYELAEKIQNKHFIYLFRGSGLEVVYHKLMKKIQGNQILQKVVDEQGRGTGSLVLGLFQSEDYGNLLEVSKDYSQNIYESFENGEYWVSLDLLERLIRINLFSYPWLITDRTKEELTPLLENASDLIESSLKLANTLGYTDIKCELLKHKALLFHFQNRDEYKDVIKSMKALASEHGMNHYVKLSDDLLHEFNEESPFPEGPDDFPKSRPIEECSDEEINEMHRRLAELAGIDLEKGDDKIANIVRIGLKDRNPERILKNCSHLEVAVGSYGIPGEMIGLPTAGFKFLFCRYGGGVYGVSLDVMYEGFFRKDHCVNCEHHSPLPNDWKWSLAWQQEKERGRTDEFQRFIDAFNRI